MKKIFRIHDKDNIVIAIQALPKGELIEDNALHCVLASDIQSGHKIASTHIAKGEMVIKYGMSIGYAIRDIEVGEHVHTHNLTTGLSGTLDYTYFPKELSTKYPKEELSFNGYVRDNGEVGIRNELWIIPTVGCINSLSDMMISEFLSEQDSLDIDGIYAFKHPYGCSQLGDDLENTRTILQDLVKHPNTGGVLVFGLGCENNIVKEFEATLRTYNKGRIKFLIAQESDDEISEGVELIRDIYEHMRHDKRTEVPLHKLRIGLKCGGSDGFSGITANPLVGMFSDWLVSQGATSVLTEVPEMFGAETILMERAIDNATYTKIVELINNFKEYFMKHEQPVFENPSPGNKDGGISTLEEKSLGCIQKAGNSTIIDVLAYGEKIKKEGGVNLVNAPGNDGVSSTVLGAAGCQMVLFTTGRGTPLGTFVPTLKIASNTYIATKKPRWIDFNAGTLLEVDDKQILLRELINYVIDVASGKKTNNEINNFRDITIFKTGITL